MRIIIFIISIFILFWNNTIYAGWIDPITGTNTEYGNITSTFGPRVYPDHGDFHKGIDYTSAEGNFIYACNDGTDIQIHPNVDAAGYWLQVGGVRYLHLKGSEKNSKYGVFQIGSGIYGIYLQRNGQDVVICNSIHEESARKVTPPGCEKIKDISEYDTSITAGEIVAVSGGSGYGRPNAYTSHLHVDLKTSATNYPHPFRNIPYSDGADPQANISIIKPQQDERILVGTTITVVADIDASRDKDVNKIEFLYRNVSWTAFTSLFYVQFDKDGRMVNLKDWDDNSNLTKDEQEKAMRIISDRNKTYDGIYPDNTKIGHYIFKYNWKGFEKLQTGEYEIKTVVVDIKGKEASAVNKFRIMGKEILYKSHIASPTNPDVNKYVLISNPQQTPTPALTEGMTPQYPTVYPTATVEIDTFIKGMMLGMTGGLDFSYTKYKEGYKAIGIAAYTLLLNEIKKNKRNNKGYDILVNGYSDKQRYYIPYIDFNSFSNNNVKNAINTAYNEIAVTMTAYDAGNTITQYYVKTFWPEKVSKYVRDDGVEIPDYHPLVFPCIDGKGTTLIQSAIDEMGEYMAYLNTTRVEEDVSKNAPESLRNCTKAGMSAFGAMRYAEKGVPNSGEKVAENILKYFYRPAPVILKKLRITQGKADVYNKEWSKAYLIDEKNAMRTLTGTAKNVTPRADAYMELYFTEKIADGMMILKSKNFSLGIPKVINTLNLAVSITASTEYPEIVKLTITATELTTLVGTITGTTKTEDVIITVSCRDELTRNQIDANPGDVAYSMLDGKDTYQNDLAFSDESHHISVIIARDADAAKQGTDYENVTATPETGDDVEKSLPKVSLDIDLSELLKMLKLDLSHINLLELLKGLNVDIGCLSEADRNKLKDVNIGSETQVKNNLTTDLKTYLNSLNTGANIDCLNLNGIILKDLFKLPQIAITLPDIQKILFEKTLFRSYNIV